MLALGGININAQIPKSFWTQAYFKYSDDALKAPRQFSFMYYKGHPAEAQIGREFGRDPRGQGRTWDPSALNAKKATYYKDGKVVSEPKR